MITNTRKSAIVGSIETIEAIDRDIVAIAMTIITMIISLADTSADAVIGTTTTEVITIDTTTVITTAITMVTTTTITTVAGLTGITTIDVWKYAQ
ncbi:hypothetical protein NBRC116583_16540 [Arenicella sp. 4NH20-0111]